MTAENIKKSKEKQVEVAEPDNELVKAPDGGYGWVVLVASFVSYLLNFFLNNGAALDTDRMGIA